MNGFGQLGLERMLCSSASRSRRIEDISAASAGPSFFGKCSSRLSCRRLRSMNARHSRKVMVSTFSENRRTFGAFISSSESMRTTLAQTLFPGNKISSRSRRLPISQARSWLQFESVLQQPTANLTPRFFCKIVAGSAHMLERFGRNGRKRGHDVKHARALVDRPVFNNTAQGAVKMIAKAHCGSESTECPPDLWREIDRQGHRTGFGSRARVTSGHFSTCCSPWAGLPLRQVRTCTRLQMQAHIAKH